MVGVPGCEIEEPWGPHCQLQLVKPAQLKIRHPHPVMDVVKDVEADRYAVGIGGEVHGGDLIEFQNLQDEKMEGKS